MPRPLRRAGAVLFRLGLFALVGALAFVGLAVVWLETPWGSNQIRELAVTLANRYLAAHLSIDRLDGSLLRGVQLDGVRLEQAGTTVVAIERVTVGYSLRQLVGANRTTTIRSLELVRPRVVAERGPDGRWNLAALVRARPSQPGGPQRMVRLDTITVVDGTIDLRSPVSVGAIRMPSTIRALDAQLSFASNADGWRLAFDQASWRGEQPDLTVTRLSGRLSNLGQAISLERLRVETPRSAFVVDGSVRRQPATVLDLTVQGERFAFQEWAGLLPGLRNIAVDTSLSVRLQGPRDALDTTIDLPSTGGTIRGSVRLDTTTPGWRGVGQLDVSSLDLAKWLNRPDRVSDITGRVEFDLDLELGRRFPRGRYRFSGPHVAYLGYDADDVNATGTLSTREALITRATATAYGANVRVDAGAIGLDSPFRYRFDGAADGVDLRRLPPNVPLPHVASTLSLDFDVYGQFSNPVIVGRAELGASSFLDVAIAPGTVGTIDTSVRPVRYTGEGDVSEVALQRLGAGLDVAWMRDPRYAGTIAGHFRVEGAGSEAASMTLVASGRLRRAELFHGALSDADVSLRIADGSLHATYSGALVTVDPAVALDDPRWAASLTGTASLDITVRDLLVRTVTPNDYDIAGRLVLADSAIRGVQVTEALVDGTLRGRTLTGRASVDGPSLAGRVEGTLELDGRRSSTLTYAHAPLDLTLLGTWIGRPLSGTATGSGRLTGPFDALHAIGTTRVSLLAAARVNVLDTSLDYDVVVPVDQPHRVSGRVSGWLDRPSMAGTGVDLVSGAVTIEEGLVGLDAQISQGGRLEAEVHTGGRLDTDRRTFDLSELLVTWRGLAWRTPAGAMTRVEWTENDVQVEPLTLTDRDGRQRVVIDGRWRADGDGALHVAASGVFLDAFSEASTPPVRLGGTLDGEATIRPAANGSLQVDGRGTISSGRFRRVPFERLTAQVKYGDGALDLDGRLDQAPGVWVTVVGRAPATLFDTNAPAAPVQLAVASSAIDLGLIEGITQAVRDVEGRVTVNVSILGTSHDPHFEGTLDVSGAAFMLRTTGSRYRHGRAAIRLARDRVAIDTLRVEDSRGRSMTLTGSLGTHELKVGDFTIDVASTGFEVMRNEFGTLEIDTALSFRGQFESPKVTGTVTVTGGALNVDRILDRTLLAPYTTESTPVSVATAAADPLAALNPWDRIGLDIAVHTPGTLRMVGEDVQISPGTPLGLGNVTLRAYGDLYLYKDPAKPLFVTGTLDSLVGTYAFQGRRFDIDPASSVIFRGDLNPELYVTLRRTIAAIEARVSIVGPLNDPELRLTSTPALDASDILSLIVFNTQLNQLSAGQQQELAVRAGTLAAGFLAAPLISALERSLGLDILEIEPTQDTAGAGSAGLGTRVTIGDEIAPGLIARFSRQFGGQEYNEASVEYYLSRLFRIRATFSDAGSVVTSRFRRVERAGVDFLIFFSF